MLAHITTYFDRTLTRKRIFKAALLACALFLYMFPVRYLLYQTIAPQGWHVAVPVGSESYAYKYAISPEVSGLILSCGFAACFRSHDDGRDWQKIEVPAVGDLSAPPGGNGTFFLQAFDFDSPISLGRRIWVSHDAGTTWKRISAASNINTIEQGIYRDGIMYDIGGPTFNSDTKNKNAFAFSNDDGQTWSYPEQSPSIAEQAGWTSGGGSIHDIAPDYSSSRAWFRILFKNGQSELLEHSSDGGKGWVTSGLIANYNDGIFSLATTPFRATHLCIAISRYSSPINEAPPVILASKDSGVSWTSAVAPTDPNGTSGAIEQNVQIGQTGNCYIDHYYTTLDPGDTPTSQTFTGNEITTTTIWELPVNSSKLITLFQSTDYYFEFEYTQTLVFIPTRNNTPSHLTIAVYSRNLAVELMFNDSPQLLLWKAVD